MYSSRGALYVSAAIAVVCWTSVSAATDIVRLPGPLSASMRHDEIVFENGGMLVFLEVENTSSETVSIVAAFEVFTGNVNAQILWDDGESVHIPGGRSLTAELNPAFVRKMQPGEVWDIPLYLLRAEGKFVFDRPGGGELMVSVPCLDFAARSNFSVVKRDVSPEYLDFLKEQFSIVRPFTCVVGKNEVIGLNAFSGTERTDLERYVVWNYGCVLTEQLIQGQFSAESEEFGRLRERMDKRFPDLRSLLRDDQYENSYWERYGIDGFLKVPGSRRILLY